MSTTAVPSARCKHERERRESRHEARGGHLPVADLDRAKAFYAGSGGGSTPTSSWRHPRDPVHSAGLAVLDPLRPGPRRGPAGFGPGAVPDRLRHRGRAGRPDQARRRGRRDLPPDAGGSRPANGPAPDRATYNSFAAFNDPDGNGWLLQEVTGRLPGRVDPGRRRTRERPRERAAARRGRPRRAREAHRRGRRELARLVRGVHGQRAGWGQAATLTVPHGDITQKLEEPGPGAADGAARCMTSISW